MESEKGVHRCFTERNVKEFFLFPYITIEREKDRVIIFNDFTNRGVIINGKEEVLMKFINRLKAGLDEEELIEILKTELYIGSPVEWIKECIQGGIIE
ncbi:hypothetical protein [Zhenpiania hominis]|uniref:hypothetical protein n=1 Tax=Zhenpiania hominis TaxID=2763644 RepID=UPI0039F5593C